MGEFLDGLDEVRVLGFRRGGGSRRCGREGLRVGGEEGEAEGEGRGGEDGEGFGEDVGYCFLLEEVRVELVAFFVFKWLVCFSIR